MLLACGNDDDSAKSDSEKNAAFCEAYASLFFDQTPTAEEIRAVADIAPKSARDSIDAIAEGFDQVGESYWETPEFEDQLPEANAAYASECADARISVKAADYRYDGLQSTQKAQVLAVEFTNVGAEYHEIIVARKKDGVDKTFDEILELGQEGAGEFVDVTFGTFAAPGKTMIAVLDLSKPGEYLAFCSIPVGATPDNEEGSGPPHWAEGMKVEFTVE